MPSAALAKALLPTKGMPGGSKRLDSWREDYPATSDTSGFAGLGVAFVRGDDTCRLLVEGHPVAAGSSAGETLRSAHLVVNEMVSSMQTEADAALLMEQNVAQLRDCHRFTAQFQESTYTFKHDGKASDDPITGGQVVTHRLRADLGSRGQIVLWMLESRLGGEVLFLNLNPGDRTGLGQMPTVSFIAGAKFADTMTDYRKTHPRSA